LEVFQNMAVGLHCFMPSIYRIGANCTVHAAYKVKWYIFTKKSCYLICSGILCVNENCLLYMCIYNGYFYTL